MKEYPRPDKIQDDLKGLLDNLEAVAKDSKYQTLENLLKTQQWREADNETYRLMITTVGKEEGQYFDEEDLINFPCEDLKAIDGLWVKYSQGKFGFSVQKKIYVDCGATLDGQYPGDKIWYEFCDRVGWRKDNKYQKRSDFKASLSLSPKGEFPSSTSFRRMLDNNVGRIEISGLFNSLCIISAISKRFMECNTSQF